VIAKWPKTILALGLLLLALFCAPASAQITPGPAPVTDKYTSPPLSQAFAAKDNSFAQLEVGDKTKPVFQPHLKLDRWGGECSFSAQLQHNEASPQVITEAGKIKWLGDKVEAHFYDTGSLKEDEGGYEFEIVLKEPPKSNVISFTIQTKSLEFLYQPALTPAEIAKGAKRPENVVGSYAVYHQTMAGDYTALGGQNYKAGKAFHIFRPRIEDAAGAWCWGGLNLDAKAGLLTVTIPQDWLDKAVYPVRHAAGLEFGYHTVGATQGDYAAADYECWVAKAYGTPASNGILNYITVCCLGSAENVQFKTGIYSDDGGSPSRPNVRLAAGSAYATASDAEFDWVHATEDYNYPITSNTQYWLGVGTVENANLYTKYDTGTATVENYFDESDDLPATWTNWDYWPRNNRYSIFATYSAGGGVTGTLAGTLAAVTGSIAGAHGVAGTAAGTLGSVTGSAAGVVRAEGAMAGTLSPVTGAASGAHGVAGSMAGVLATATGVFSGAHGVAGSAAGTLGNVTGAVTGVVRAEGGLAGTLAPVTGSISGAHGVAGTAAGTLVPVTGEMSGTVAGPGEVTGTLAGTLGAVSGSAAGAHGVAGTVAGALAPVTGSASGTVRAEGALAGNLPAVTGSAAGAHGVAGSVSGTLSPVTAAISAVHGVAGTAAGTLPPVTGNFSGAHGVAGTLAGEPAQVIGAIAGAHGVAGNLAGDLPPLTGDFTGLVFGLEAVTGQLAGTTAPLTGSWQGIAGSGQPGKIILVLRARSRNLEFSSRNRTLTWATRNRTLTVQ
jgi:hypothetical protein